MNNVTPSKPKRILKYVILAILALTILAYFDPMVRSKVNWLFMLFRSMSVDMIVGYVRSLGSMPSLFPSS